MGKQKTPGGIPCRVFCFPMGKQKILGDVYSNLNLKILKNRQNEVWKNLLNSMYELLFKPKTNAEREIW